ncbi:MAG: FAD-dependent oxidoreductase [Opitutales bacterium]|jgi:hypothetical protein|nr:FAD-dependent oxidoreductase [Opitutales bacterium]MBT5167479.1 FAD-dependent oxidoreductase [Opitutales bacterium]MBT5815682.1 FAD-dependent oxidoreductase [Opitutales bacterium]MBT6769469.1 FAD-dependent oxidoreductase [Opitutales bacterium]
MKKIYPALVLSLLMAVSLIRGAEHYDVVVYGGTPGGIASAVSAAREGASVILLEQTNHVGGLSTSGLNRDEGNHMIRWTLGGISERFTREAARRSGTDPDTERARIWVSRIAEELFLEMLEEQDIPVAYEQLIEGVEMDGPKIKVLKTRGGDGYLAKIFIDATYEGDLLAAAGVSYTVGRESRDTYNESMAGVRYMDEKIKVSPYDANGKLLPGIMPGRPPKEFSASPVPLSYNVRLNLSLDPANQASIEKPEGYEPRQYELLVGSFQSGEIKEINQILALYPMPDDKRECNNRQFSIVSLSMPGEQTPWAESSFEEREVIHKKYRDYTHGLLWFLKTDPRVPAGMREDMAQYGFCKDEWQDNDHWPWYLYIRAARRMQGEYILTQADVITSTDKKNVIHIGSHYIDAHHVTRYAVDQDHYINEGRIWQEGVPFDIPYGVITPKSEECENLLVPVCASTSAVAQCTIRLEPTWMHLGEVSGIAATMSIKNQSSVQDIDVAELQERIKAVGIPLKQLSL